LCLLGKGGGIHLHSGVKWSEEGKRPGVRRRFPSTTRVQILALALALATALKQKLEL